MTQDENPREAGEAGEQGGLGMGVAEGKRRSVEMVSHCVLKKAYSKT